MSGDDANRLVAHLRAEVVDLRHEIAEIRGQGHALSTGLERLADEMTRNYGALFDKLDAVIGMKSGMTAADADHTAKIRLVQEDIEKLSARVDARGWRDRMGWIYGGVITGVGALYAILKMTGKVP